MKALTVSQPWAYLISTGQKRIENRSWATKFRGLLAIHAGLSFYDEDFDYVEKDLGLKLPSNLPGGAVVGIVRLADVVQSSADPLFVGPFGWVLADARLLPEPIGCRGALGLWQPKDTGVVEDLEAAAKWYASQAGTHSEAMLDRSHPSQRRAKPRSRT